MSNQPACTRCPNVRGGNSAMAPKKCIIDPRHRDVWEYCIVNPKTGLPLNGGPPHPGWCPVAEVVTDMLSTPALFLQTLAPQIYRGPATE